mgnify:CR=1 FL=1
MNNDKTEIQEPARDAQADSARERLSQEARMYQCGPGGPIVSNPQDCRDMDTSRSLPPLQITG